MKVSRALMKYSFYNRFYVVRQAIHTFIRPFGHRTTGSDPLVLLVGITVALVLDQLQFPFLHYIEHRLLREQRGAHVGTEALR
jgi:hypothetical protein